MVHEYIKPPRPEKLITPEKLDFFENDGYICQPKLNGSCCVVIDQTAWNRHGEPMTKMAADLRPIPQDTVIVGEYLNKSKKAEGEETFEHKLVIFDILKHKGQRLIGTSLRDRLDILGDLFPCEQAVVGGTPFQHIQRATNDLWRVNSYMNNFKNLYNQFIQTDLYEGIVLKRLDAKMSAGSNSGWQVKVRKPTKNYRQ